MFKKSQAAMEFLMTYGWAILVVLIAIAALAYFGVLNPTQFLPRSCTLASGLGCDDFQIKGDESATVILRNGFGQDMSSVIVGIGGCGADSTSDPTITNGRTGTYTDFTCTGVTAGERFQEDVNVTYKLGTSTVTHTIQGTLTTKVEP